MFRSPQPPFWWYSLIFLWGLLPCSLSAQTTPSTFTQLAAGPAQSLALRSDGTLWVWGNNDFGQLGDGTSTQRNAPVLLPTPAGAAPATTWTQVTAGYTQVLALRSDNSLWAWGRNFAGQLGDGTVTARNRPTAVVVPAVGVGTSWTQLSIGLFHSLALRSDGTLWGWGSNEDGQLNIGASSVLTPTLVRTPAAAAAGTYWTQVSAGARHTMALRSDGTLWGWGNNETGQLGDNTALARTTPVRIPVPATAPTGARWTQVAAGPGGHCLGLLSDGTLWAWGDNRIGQLGVGDFEQHYTPTRVPTPAAAAVNTTWQRVVVGTSHTLALRSDGTLWAWGNNTYGYLGLNSGASLSTSPQQEYTQEKWTDLATGSYHSLALSGGRVYASGRNLEGQLGLGSTQNALYFFVRIVGLPLPNRTAIHSTPSQVYPNPAHQHVVLEDVQAGTTLVLTDLQGRRVREQTVRQEGQLVLDLQPLPAGVYWLMLTRADALVQTTRLLVD